MKKLEFFLRKLLLKILLLLKSSKKEYPDSEKIFSNILLIRLNRIGDALVTTPFIHQLKKNLECKITLLADEKNYFVFNNNPDIDNVIRLKKGIDGFLEIMRFIKKENFDTIVDLHDDVSTTVSFLLAFCNVKNKFGLEKENKIIYTAVIPKLNPEKNHVVMRLLELLRLFQIKPDVNDIKICFYPSDNSFLVTNKILQERFSRKKFLVGINISAGSEARFWGVEKFKLLIKYLKEFEIEVILLCAPNDIDPAKQITQQDIIFSSRNYEEFAAMISKLNLLITPDTAAVHLAAAYGIPVFGIYVKYKTNDMIWSPLGSQFESVITDEPNLDSISFQHLKEKLENFLKILLNNYKIISSS